MIEKKEVKTTIGIRPHIILINIIGFISSITTITLAIIYLNVTLVILCILALLLIISVAFVIVFLKNIYKIKDEYNILIRDYNTLVDELTFANDNRETLQEIIKDNSEDIKNIKFEIDRKNSIINVLWFFYSHKAEAKPNKKDLKNAMQIEQGKVNSHEK